MVAAAAAATRSEKVQLQALKHRFTGYIDRVRQPVVNNCSLEGEAAALRQQQVGCMNVRSARCAARCCTWAPRYPLRLEQEHLLEDFAHVHQCLHIKAQ